MSAPAFGSARDVLEPGGVRQRGGPSDTLLAAVMTTPLRRADSGHDTALVLMGLSYVVAVARM